MAEFMISVAERLAATYQEQVPNGGRKAAEFVSLSDTLKTMRDALEDAEIRRFKEKVVSDWWSWLEIMMSDMDDVLHRWDHYILQRKITQNHHQRRKEVEIPEDIGSKIAELKDQIDMILRYKDEYGIGVREPAISEKPRRAHSASMVDSKQVHGRDSDKDGLVTTLTAKDASIQVLSIAGMAGVGKTTLAQLVYNDDRIQENFKLRIWISVSDHFDEAEIAKEIIEGVKEFLSSNLTDHLTAGKKKKTKKKKKNSTAGMKSGDTNQIETPLNSLARIIKGKKFLIVLDDIRREEGWEPLLEALNHGGAGSGILVTTRNEKVAEAVTTNGIHRPGHLSDTDSWAIMKRAALFGRSDAEDGRFHDIGKRIATKCKGLPLAAMDLGSLLHSKSSYAEWENVAYHHDSVIWREELYHHFLTSYNELPSKLKRCFSFFAIFPKDSEIGVGQIIEMWTALGYLGSEMEFRGREFIGILAKHSLIQNLKKDELDDQIKSFKMHEIVRDFAKFIRWNRLERTETICEVCHPSAVYSVRQYRTLFLEHSPLLSLCPCLTITRLLRTRYTKQGIPQGFENSMIHLRWLDLCSSDLSIEDFRIICKIYNLRTLLLRSCGLRKIPLEIVSLIHLQHLILSGNKYLQELPESICGLLELRILDVSFCESLSILPRGIHRLTKLKHFNFEHTKVRIFPEEAAKLNSLNTVSEFRVGSGWNKWRLVKKWNQLSGSLSVWIKLTEDSGDVIEEIREAEMKKKVNIKEYQIVFKDEMDDEKESSIATRSRVLDALELPPNLQNLTIYYFKGSKLPMLKLNQIKKLHLYRFVVMQKLPPLGQLPSLEEVEIFAMLGLRVVGREFLGITSSVALAGGVSFPSLKKLIFYECSEWEGWEDITAEEEESSATSIMPRLRTMHIMNCRKLKTVPYRLLGKAASLEELDVYGSDISVHETRQYLSKFPDLRVTEDRFVAERRRIQFLFV